MLAKHYAAALLELAVEAKNQHRVRDDLAVVEQMIEKSDDFRTAINSKILNKQQFMNAVADIFKKNKINELVIRFSKVMIKNGRIGILPETIEAFRKLLAELEGETEALVTTAASLSAKQLTNLSESLKSLSDKKVIIKQKVDPKILGGVVINIGSRMIDASINRKLERLRIAQKNASA